MGRSAAPKAALSEAAAGMTTCASLMEEQQKTIALCMQFGLNKGLHSLGVPLRLESTSQVLVPSVQIWFLGRWFSLQDVQQRQHAQ
mmetsp:Transcript_14550/g.46907  ORF Transcript_14550/g.46907 Transcript_14550/m.46907 type:complete len:86 (-) Transcript_14550:687-944(-)